jgi:uncharacterized protein (UPF0332 family)
MAIDYNECVKNRKITEFSSGRDIAPKEIETASKDLETAKKSAAEKNYKWATVQLYYSMFHTARALLYAAGYREHSHACLVLAMRELYVKKEKMPAALVEALQQAKNLREEADYYDRWSETGCNKLIKSAGDFLEYAKNKISGTGK